jgi:hypothetical protein
MVNRPLCKTLKTLRVDRILFLVLLPLADSIFSIFWQTAVRVITSVSIRKPGFIPVTIAVASFILASASCGNLSLG